MHELTQARVLVIGDVMLDHYWEGEAHRISPEAPVPVVHVNHEFYKAGGAANVALNIAALQGEATVLGITGEDEAAHKLKTILNAPHLSSYFYTMPNITTIRKLRILSRNQQLLRADFENFPASLDLSSLEKLFASHLNSVNLVIFSDYGKGTLRNSEKLIKLARAKGKQVLVDPKGEDFSIYAHASLITPNRKEFEAVAGPCASENEMAEKALALMQAHYLEAILVTRGAEGMSLFQQEHPPIHIPTRAQEVYDVTGAGDTVIAVLGMALSAGHSLETAMNLANSAAGIVVGKTGTATLSLVELQQSIHTNSELQLGVLEEPLLKKLVIEAKHKGETVVMTNGCFDILHAGHIDYLTRAKALGDRLIVAVNTDESVRRLKGASRPINTLAHRMKLLAALGVVDWVVPFSEDTPERLIKEIMPDVLVKGADYKVNEIAGSSAVLEQGGKVVTIALTPDCATTATIEKIRQNQTITKKD